MNKEGIFTRLAIMTVGALTIAGLSIPTSSAAISPVTLGSANNFGLIAGGGLTNSGQSTLTGDLALTPVISYADAGLLTVKGAYHFGDSAALAAQSAATTSYGMAISESPSVVIAAELAGQTLLPGIYTNVSGLSVNGTLNLDAQNNPNALFVLQTPLALSTGAASHITLLNGAQACNVYWQVGTTSTIGAGSDFKGNLLGKGNFASAAASVILGRVFIGQGSVALNATQITRPVCNKDVPSITSNIGNGEGAYVSTFGNANFNFNVKGTDLGNGVFTNANGRVTWNVAKAWKFNGVLTGFSYVNNVGTVTGTGTLNYFSSTKMHHDGRWLSASNGVVNFTVKFTRTINTNATLGKVNTFAIGFTGIAAAGAPGLPALGALVQVKGGAEGSNG